MLYLFRQRAQKWVDETLDLDLFILVFMGDHKYLPDYTPSNCHSVPFLLNIDKVSDIIISN